MNRIASYVQKLTPYTPGEQPKDPNLVKLNTNENPYPPSPKVAQALASFDVSSLRRYPDPVCSALRQKIASLCGVSPANVFVGNGSDEILTLAARAFVEDSAAIGSFDPSYSLYKTLAAIRNVRFVPSPLEDDFSWRAPVTDDVSLFLLTNPNAPTSVLYPPETVAAFADSFPGVVIVDEAYADFAESNCIPLAARPGNENVIVMRTLSKSFSLAGLRLGYCIGPAPLIEALEKVKDSYNIDGLAQTAALAALSDLDWMRANVRKVADTRAAVSAELRRRGWNLPDSQSNFLFARPAHRPASEIFEALRARHVFVRWFPGPKTGDRIRITIGTPAEMDTLLAALAELDVPPAP